jgi:hypothetical protein
MDSLEDQARVEAVAVLSRFRRGFYDSLTRRADALFELTDALLCADGPVASLAELSVELVHRRGHGAMYDALVAGRIDAARLRRALTGLDLPRGADRQLTIAIDVTPWPRPDAECSPGRLHCHRPCRCDGVRQTIPGWPYQVAVALAGGRSSWTWPLDVVRLGPDDDLTAVTAAQIRALVARLTQAGQWRPDDPPILFVVDAGYDVVRLSWLLGEVPVRLLGRVRADRVVYGPAGRRRGDHPGRPPRHGAVFRLGDPVTHPVPAQASTSTHDRFGKAVARCWGWLHPKLERRSSWADHKGQLPIVEGTLVHLGVERLPGDRDPKPLWLWYSHPDAAAVDVDRLWRIFLRRFDVEHTFRLFKQTLGLTRATPAQPRASRPVGLADRRRLHPAPPRPAAGRGLAPPLGAALDARSAHPVPRPAWLSSHPPRAGHASQCAETLPARSRPPQGSHLRPGTPLPGRQKATQSRHASSQQNYGQGLKPKLRGHSGTGGPGVTRRHG